MAVTGKASFKCDNCNEEHTIKAEDTNFQVVEVAKRNMGEAVHYVYEYEQNCEKCGKRIDIEFDLWEYPKGSVHESSYTLSGAKEVTDEFELVLPKK